VGGGGGGQVDGFLQAWASENELADSNWPTAHGAVLMGVGGCGCGIGGHGGDMLIMMMSGDLMMSEDVMLTEGLMIFNLKMTIFILKLTTFI
jgi:hypothetical protein